MKTYMLLLLVIFNLLACQKTDLETSEQLFHSPLKYPASEDWMLIQGYLNVADCSVHFFAQIDSAGLWQPDAMGTTFALPGPSDFQFAYSYDSSRFSIRSPHSFHHEDFSIWDDSGFCNELADLSNYQIYPELNYWVLEARLGTEFTSCIETTSKLFAFRFSFFQ